MRSLDSTQRKWVQSQKQDKQTKVRSGTRPSSFAHRKLLRSRLLGQDLCRASFLSLIEIQKRFIRVRWRKLVPRQACHLEPSWDRASWTSLTTRAMGIFFQWFVLKLVTRWRTLINAFALSRLLRSSFGRLVRHQRRRQLLLRASWFG